MMPGTTGSFSSKLETKKHISLFLRCLRLLPQPYTAADDQRMTLGYFAVSGLDLLNGLDKIPSDERTELLDWVYDQQSPSGGFRGGPSAPFPANASSSSANSAGQGTGNIAMTYAALLILAVLRDDFSRLDRQALLRWVAALQDKEEGGGGGFAAEEGEGVGKGGVDRDPRFTYCAVAICSMLGEWGEIDTLRVRHYVEACQRYDGGFGASKDHESHSGMTYCCVAALKLLPPCSRQWDGEEDAVNWIAHRQVQPSSVPFRAPAVDQGKERKEADGGSDSEEDGQEELAGGFQGRPSKLPPDVCYSFWNGGSLSLLGQHELIDAELDAGYVLSAQSRVGGISKIPGDHPDLLHSYLGLASLALHQDTMQLGIKPLNAAWNCSEETADWIRRKLIRQ